MARSGDWITPRLDGQPWFEKPPLLYWTTALGHLCGFSGEWAARLPVALISLAFLWFFHRTLEREFSRRTALTATAILGTSAGWAALSFAAVTDLPMAAALNAAMLVALFGPQALGARGTGGREGRYRAQGLVAGVLLGLAMLAKGFVPLVLIAPVFLIARGKRWRILTAAVLTAGPWYLLCWWVNGRAFWEEFFWRHHVARFFSPSLEHVQPFWYYIPVFLAGLFPWTPLVALIGRPRSLDDERVRFLLLYLVYGLLFFSASTNKLPAYVLPLLPAMAVVLAVALEKARSAAWWLAACGLLLAAVPLIAAILPEALNTGITHVEWGIVLGWPLLLAVAAAGAAWWLARDDADQEWSDRRRWAALTVACAAVVSVLYLKAAAFPAMDRQVSVRAFWREHSAEAACLDPALRRAWVYGLNYYAERALPACAGEQPGRIVTANQKLAVQ
jgi:4-amino-4-deoxy-L-arabinose transferase-like glycosyltransferase